MEQSFLLENMDVEGCMSQGEFPPNELTAAYINPQHKFTNSFLLGFLQHLGKRWQIQTARVGQEVNTDGEKLAQGLGMTQLK